MIDFQYKLPRKKVEGKRVGQYNNPELLLPGLLTTSDFRLGEFLHLLHNVVADERRLLFIDGQVISCCHNWIRDHVHMMKAFRHWDYKLKSFLQFIIEKQTEEGFYFELVKQLDDAHHTVTIAQDATLADIVAISLRDIHCVEVVVKDSHGILLTRVAATNDDIAPLRRATTLARNLASADDGIAAIRAHHDLAILRSIGNVITSK